MSNQIDLIEEINKIPPQCPTLFTTFTYSQDFFEREVFPRFKDKSYPLILIDQNEYQKSIKEFRKSKFAERKYFVEQIKCKNIFHPKILLAISDEKIWFFIGSNNLTYDGYLRNAELVVPIIIDLNDSSGLNLIPQIKQILDSLKKLIKSTFHQEAIR
jgi:phosphatidylserine/phosphatidylglycerophosphate/cardiolipin synthase-like enzyme